MDWTGGGRPEEEEALRDREGQGGRCAGARPGPVWPGSHSRPLPHAPRRRKRTRGPHAGRGRRI